MDSVAAYIDAANIVIHDQAVGTYLHYQLVSPFNNLSSVNIKTSCLGFLATRPSIKDLYFPVPAS